MNTITIELCAEDRARLNKILAALEGRPNCTTCAQQIIDYVSGATGHTEYGFKADGVEYATDTEAAEAKMADIPEPYTEPTPFEEPAPAEPVDFGKLRDDVRQKVVELSANGKKAQVRDIIKAYAANVTTLPDDKLSEVMAKLTALEG